MAEPEQLVDFGILGLDQFLLAMDLLILNLYQPQSIILEG